MTETTYTSVALFKSKDEVVKAIYNSTSDAANSWASQGRAKEHLYSSNS